MSYEEKQRSPVFCTVATANRLRVIGSWHGHIAEHNITFNFINFIGKLK